MLVHKELYIFYKVFKENKPVYLLSLIPTLNSHYNTRSTIKIIPKLLYFTLNITFSKIIFFHLLLLNKTCQILTFEVPLVLVFSKRISVSQLREHKLKHIFQDTLSVFCSGDLVVKTNTHFFLYCPLFNNQRFTCLSIVNDIYYIDSSFTNTNDSMLTYILLFGKASLDISATTLIINSAINYIISTNRFEESLFQSFLSHVHLFNSFPYPYVFFYTIHLYSFFLQVCFFLLFINIIFYNSSCLHPGLP